ncbi:hypothetical protein [Tunturibacter empetritectus]|uniref:Uncharacterized protein n=1 Tax=Tunturiibacter empetritectus TaxID=3069691 RepID=A0A7W8MSZ7_9BACT|nr:hypothetical protein [Edaphobacter lichenicola]MBB5318370.1 hypothetical protein [Edaphobacter lichenicola]
MKQGPKKVVSVLLSLIVLSAGFLDYWSYSRAFHAEPGIWMDVVGGTANAPNQYRIGVIDSAYFLAQHTHLALRHMLTVVDVIAGLVAVFALFTVLRRSARYREAGLAGQWFGAAGFLVLVQFYLAWLLWYQRPETLPTAAILALALLLLAVPLRGGVAVVGFLVLTVAQGFVRADVAFALHVGILLVCLTPLGRGFAMPRGLQAGTSVVSLLVVLGIQYWLMRRMFPLATYGNTPVFQLLSNLSSPVSWLPFALFMGPFAWTVGRVVRQRERVEAAGAGMLAGALVFLGMWLVVGRMEEVRIFLPFALALTPLTTELAMWWFVPGEVADAPAGSV